MDVPILTLIILACTLNVSEPDVHIKECKVLEQEIHDSQMTQFTCMMASLPQLAKMFESHPGYMPRKWKCVYRQRQKKI